MPLLLACPPSDSELLFYRLEELAGVLVISFPASLMLGLAIVAGVHAGRSMSR